jgi:uncharacterized membrane protein YraQ (UPF0718 family)
MTSVILYSLCIVLLVISLIKDRDKTKQVLIDAFKQFLGLYGYFLIIIIVISVSLYFIKEETLITVLGKKPGVMNIILSALMGSIAAIPAFITFPLAGILKNLGVPWSVLAAFTNSLMLVGVLTFPLERRFLGTKLALFRNIISFIISIIIAIVTGLILGDFR